MNAGQSRLALLGYGVESADVVFLPLLAHYGGLLDGSGEPQVRKCSMCS